MSEPFIGEIRIFSGTFDPVSWALCDGRLMEIAQYSALFAVLGTRYGGNGRTDFALPNLQAAVPMHPGSGPGLTPRRLGEEGGNRSITLDVGHLPSHTHTLKAYNNKSDTTEPKDNAIAVPWKARGSKQQTVAAYHSESNTNIHGDSLTNAGAGEPHNNMQPYLALRFIIALEGLFPSRS